MRSGSKIASSFVVALGATSLVVGAFPASVGAETSPSVGQLDLVGPEGSEQFGRSVVVLATGDYVVTDPLWDSPSAIDVGAVYLYDGVTNEVISTLTGSSDDDMVGFRGVTALDTGGFIVSSPSWSNGDDNDVGAVTWAGPAGISGPVTTENSLHGVSSGDFVGSGGVTMLDDGSFVVTSSSWSDGVIDNLGAVTWIGASGATGPVSADNSLVGSTAFDSVGRYGVFALPDGEYVVASGLWDDGAIVDAGAVTRVAAGGMSGVVSTENSLHGSSANDAVGSSGPAGFGFVGVAVLSDGAFVVSSPKWNSAGAVRAGAVTWVGPAGLVGPVSTANSLHGTSENDQVGLGLSVALDGGAYVAFSPSWDDGVVADVGAVTWAPPGGVSGPVSTANSLHGTSNGDRVGNRGAVVNATGVAAVTSSSWNDGATEDVGAVTWAPPGGVVGPVSTSNSLHGATSDDDVGSGGVTLLSDGSFVVSSPGWDEGFTDGAGAVTWTPADGLIGPVSTSNSLHGTGFSDAIGSRGVDPIADGAFVVSSPSWNDGAVPLAGAVTRVDAGGVAGPVTTGNSLHGTTVLDRVGSGSVVVLETGDYVVSTGEWIDGEANAVGAATFALGATGAVGPVVADNSVFGSPPGRVLSAGSKLTSGDAVPIATGQNRVLLMLLDNPPFFAEQPADVTVTIDLANDVSSVVDYELPVATDLRSTAAVACVPESGTDFAVGDTTVECTATDSAGFTAATSFTVTVSDVIDAVSLTPARLLDTRPDGRVLAEGMVEVQVAGREGVPADGVAAAIVNVTAIDPLGRGFVTVFPCGERPLASSVNYTEGGVIANELVAKLSVEGTICAFSSESTHLAVDVVGYIPLGSGLRPLTPARLLDTRPDDRLDAESVIEVQVAGREGVPADASAAMINVTAIDPLGRGFVTVFPCGERPLASSVNYTEGGVIANELVAKLSVEGTICAFSSESTHLAVDVVGYIPN